MSDRRDLFRSWAPDGAVYTPWVKPVLFAQITAMTLSRAHPAPDLPPVDWAPRALDRTAIILDLSGPSAITTALALASRGYQPVLLINTSPGSSAILDMSGIEAAVIGGAALLPATISAGAPPAFVLDSRRLSGKPTPGSFDNRWLVFPQDFPSAHFLKAQGIERVLIVRNTPDEIGHDLRQVLVEWRRAGLMLQTFSLTRDATPVEYTPRTHWSWRPLALLGMIALGLRANSAGGFGSKVPVSSEGGGYS